MPNELTPLAPDDRFQFACGPEVPCFNACCRDLNQCLTPYDILRLKTGLSMSSSDFLSRYTVAHIGPQTGLPVVSLRPVNGEARRCPFVAPEGCRVYAHRPSSCRIYPLARAISRSRETGVVTEHFALMREAHCQGCVQPRTQTVKAWIEDQALERYHHFNDMLMGIIALKNQSRPEPLDIREQRMFQLALYDLDGFRRHLRVHGVPERPAVAADRAEKIMADDEALLTYGHAWIAWALFDKGAPK